MLLQNLYFAIVLIKLNIFGYFDRHGCLQLYHWLIKVSKGGVWMVCARVAGAEA